MSSKRISEHSRLEVSFAQKFCLNVLKAGIVPKHIAFIMDGNRRWAKKHNLSVKNANIEGYKNLIKVREWCFAVGVSEATFYTFSIENFKRSKSEVGDFMDMLTKILEYTLKYDM